MSERECDHLGIKDAGYGPYERHDEFCFLHHEWCPCCGGCSDFTCQEDDEDEDELEN